MYTLFCVIYLNFFVWVEYSTFLFLLKMDFSIFFFLKWKLISPKKKFGQNIII